MLVELAAALGVGGVLGALISALAGRRKTAAEAEHEHAQALEVGYGGLVDRLALRVDTMQGQLAQVAQRLDASEEARIRLQSEVTLLKLTLDQTRQEAADLRRSLDRERGDHDIERDRWNAERQTLLERIAEREAQLIELTARVEELEREVAALEGRRIEIRT